MEARPVMYSDEVTREVAIALWEMLVRREYYVNKEDRDEAIRLDKNNLLRANESCKEWARDKWDSGSFRRGTG